MLLNEANSHIQKSSIYEIITAPYLFQNALFFRPVVNFSFMIPILLINDSITLQYLLNIIIHCINSFLIFILLKRLKISSSVTFWLALLFAVHPVCTNSVAWLPGRNDSLLMMFIVLSFIYFDRYLDNGNYYDLTLNGIFFLIALFTKETAAAAVFIFVIYYFIKKQKKVYVLIYSAASWVIALGLWFLVRSKMVQDQGTLEYFRNLPFIIQALGKTILPFNLSVLPSINETTFIYGYISFALLIAGLLFNKSRDHLIVIFGFCWFLVFIIPPLFNVNPEYNQNLMIEARLYLPFAGIIILLSQFKIFEEISSKKIALISAVFIFAFLCYFNIRFASKYHDDITFWENAVQYSPSLDLSYSGLGLIYLQKENYERAAECYMKACVLNPIKPDYNKKAGYCLLNLNKSSEAEEYLRNELVLNPDDYDSNLLTGIICFKTGRPEDSEKLLLKAYKLNNKDFQPPLYLLKLYHQQKNYTEAYKFAKVLKSGGFKIPDDIKKDLNFY